MKNVNKYYNTVATMLFLCLSVVAQNEPLSLRFSRAV